MFKYPYGNTQELNLTWLLNAWRAFQAQIKDAIAPQYSDQATYPDPTFVWYENVLYCNNGPITTPEAWNPDHWTQTCLAEHWNS